MVGEKYQFMPKLNDEEYAVLRADIEKRGVLIPVEKDREGNTLDGHNRRDIAVALGIKYPEVVRAFATEEEKREHVYKINLARRQFDPLRWGQVFGELLKEKGVERGQGARNDVGTSATIAEVVQECGVSQRTAEHRLSLAAAYSKLPKDLKKKVDAGELTVTQAKRELKERKRQKTREANQKKIEEAATPAEATQAAKFSTVVIDPPWDWGDEGDKDQLGRARPTYTTMSFAKLLELPVGELIDTDCHIYLWITNRSLPKGFALLEKWGLRYVTCLTWCKPHFGMGNYFRGQSEQVLFAVKGSQQLKRKDVGTWFSAPRGPDGHSSKPNEFYELVESCSPGPYLEMFSRRDRPGWVHWGEDS